MKERSLEEMRMVDPRTVDRSTLKQINEVQVDSKLEKGARIAEYLRQVGNPYCYMEGKTVVKISFAESDRTIEDCIHSYLAGV